MVSSSQCKLTPTPTALYDALMGLARMADKPLVIIENFTDICKREVEAFRTAHCVPQNAAPSSSARYV